MPTLDSTLRRKLETAVKAARRAAECGAAKALETLAVGNHEPWSGQTPADRKLRVKLRACGRQVGDVLDPTTDKQSTGRIKHEVAYEQWHRMLFARFLAENNLLIEPNSGVCISLDDCRDLAKETSRDVWPLAGQFAQTMLPEIFRADDPVLAVQMAREDQLQLENILNDLVPDIFTASDSLGWCYQFWQAEKKDEVNKAAKKIGADELPSVTQLFTEDYMVDFLLDNTLGAWHAGKVLAANHKLAEPAKSEDELRHAVALPGCPWKYLRFIKDTDGKWTPAAGRFDGWPKTAKELKCLDPCMGSGHFVVAMFERLVALRLAEEKLIEEAAVAAVIRDNLFGLEIDPRCTQIGAFNLALAAWRRVGHCKLPAMNLACSGLAPNTREADWMALAGDNEKLQNGMERLYRLFTKAAVLGSLINPRAGEGDLLVAAFHELQPLLEKALAQETKDDTAHEMAVTARGLAKAAEILAGQFTLVATNVPYLGRGKQPKRSNPNEPEELADYCERVHPDAKSDLATCFVERCVEFCAKGGSTSLVTPQNWLFLSTYAALRKTLLKRNQWAAVGRLGPGAFETIGGEVVNVALLVVTRIESSASGSFFGVDASDSANPQEKAELLRCSPMSIVNQQGQLLNPDARVGLENSRQCVRLDSVAISLLGLGTCDAPHYVRAFWEQAELRQKWAYMQTAAADSAGLGGRDSVVAWDSSRQRVHGMTDDERRQGHNQDYRGREAWGKKGVSVSLINTLKASAYAGELFDKSVAVIVPPKTSDLPAVLAFASSDSFSVEVRKLDQKVMVTNSTLLKVPFDLAHWQKVAAEKYPHGLPKPFSSDPTQWLFNGHPAGADQPLHVAVARLLGYQWPRQTGSSFPDCPAIEPDGLEKHADTDGIVCLSSVRGEPTAAERLLSLLAVAYGPDWSGDKLSQLLTAAEAPEKTLDDWLRDLFFAQHTSLFHKRPFIWHVWDGLRDGFHCLVNYHKLVGPNGEGSRTLQKLTYEYLGDWISRQKAHQAAGEEGADARLAAALHLQGQLEKILEGEPPFDIFVRWKPLSQQAIGWEPDSNDGVRLNIRPFIAARPLGARAKTACILRTPPDIKWDKKDRGTEPSRSKEDFPWFWTWNLTADDFTGGKEFDGDRHNDLHYSRAHKKAARNRPLTGAADLEGRHAASKPIKKRAEK